MSKRHRHVQIAVKQYADGRWGFDDYSSGTLRKVRLKDEEAAQTRATDAAVLLANGRTDLLGIDRGELARFRQWETARKKSRTYGEVVTEFAATKRADTNLHSGYVDQLVGRAEHFARAWGHRPIGEIEPVEIANALTLLKLEPRNRNNVRDALVTVWRFARDEREYLPSDAKTAAERVKRLKIRRAVSIATYTPEQFEQILAEARAKFMPAFAISGLAGIRAHEIRPTSKEKKKDPLRWEDFHWRDGYVRVRPETSKTGEERLVPLQPALRRLLAPYRHLTGPIIDVSANEELKRIRAELGIPFTKNGFRHGYGTYRNALIHDIAKVAEELGNTVKTAKARYVRPKPEKEARRWFNPKVAPKEGKIVPFPKVPKSSKKRGSQQSISVAP